MPPTNNNKKRANFLDLPAELRNHIYELTLLPRRKVFSIKRRPDSARPTLLAQTCRISPNILATCRQIQAESTPILYGRNVFRITASNILRFIDQIQNAANYLRHIRLTADSLLQDALEAMTELENLRSFKLYGTWWQLELYPSTLQVASIILPMLQRRNITNMTVRELRRCFKVRFTQAPRLEPTGREGRPWEKSYYERVEQDLVIENVVAQVRELEIRAKRQRKMTAMALVEAEEMLKTVRRCNDRAEEALREMGRELKLLKKGQGLQ